MSDWATDVLRRIQAGSLLSHEYYAILDCDQALDARDQAPEFDSAWVAAFNRIKSIWSERPVDSASAKLIEDIRRESFLAVNRATRGHEIAGYVSDDLELIVKMRIAGIEDSFVDRLWGVYERGEFSAAERRDHSISDAAKPLMEEPAWVTLLFDRGHGHSSTRGPNDLAFLRELVHDHVAGDEQKRCELRSASLERLDDDDPRQALGFLSIVGLPSDLSNVEPFLNSPHESVRNAAKVCRFELLHSYRS